MVAFFKTDGQLGRDLFPHRNVQAEELGEKASRALIHASKRR
jgi:hypothetical protein